MPSGMTRNAFAVELPADWSPCPHCASCIRVAVAQLNTRSIHFFCGGVAQHSLPWPSTDGVEHPLIAPAVFWPGGEFAGYIPECYLGARASLDGQRFAVNDRRAMWIVNEQSGCAVCGTAPMKECFDHGAVLDWIRAIDWPEAQALLPVGVTNRRNRHTWYRDLLHDNFDAFVSINFRIEDSLLQPDQSLTRHVLTELWPIWSSDMRRIATNTLAFGFCRRCLHTKDKAIPARGELLRRHYELNHDGSIAAAQADRATWLPLLRLLQSIDEHRQRLAGFAATR